MWVAHFGCVAVYSAEVIYFESTGLIIQKKCSVMYLRQIPYFIPAGDYGCARTKQIQYRSGRT